MENYAVIGSSPIMLISSLLIANQKNNKVFIFNKDNWMGGAWRKVDTPYGRLSTHNNIIVPLNKEENLYLEDIQSLLNKFNLGCKLENTNAKIINNWKPTKKLVFDIDNLIKQIKFTNNIKLVNGACDSIKLENNKLNVNDKEFKKCLIPSRFSNIDFLINNKKLLLETVTNISHHYTFIFAYHDIYVQEKEYSEDFDDYFDRGQINKLNNKYFVLTGRLRRKFKHLSEEEIVNNYKKKFKKSILSYFKKNIYVDRKVGNCDLIIKKYPQIIHINTDQFISSFININKSLLGYL